MKQNDPGAAKGNEGRGTKGKATKSTVTGSGASKSAPRKSAATKEAARPSTAGKSPSSGGDSKTGVFDDLIAQIPSPAQAIALRLREIVHEVLPKAEETVWTKGWKLALYKDGSEICGIGPVKEYCNFYLTRGAEIPDPDGILEGKGKTIRHIKVRSVEDIPVATIKRMIREGKKLVKK